MGEVAVNEPNMGGNLQPQLANLQPQLANGEMEDDEPVIDIRINNVVSSFNTRCHLNLRKLATEGSNVEYHRQHGMLNMRLRHPFTTASIWSSGKITCTGAVSEEDAKIAARKFARKIQKLGYAKVKFTNFRVVNVLGTCSMPFAININNFSKDRKEASYEPELHPGVTYKIKDPKATLKIFSTGSITVTAPRVANVQAAIEYIYPLVSDFNAGPRSVPQPKHDRKPARHMSAHHETIVVFPSDFHSDFDDSSLDGSDGDFESDESQD